MGIAGHRTTVIAGVAIASALAFGIGAWAEEAAAPAGPASVAPPEIEPQVLEQVRRAAQLLANARKFSYRAEIGYDVVQTSGQKIEFGSMRRTLVRRPDHLFVEADQRDGSRKRLYFDGQTLSFLDVDEEAYAVAPKPGDIDGAIDFLVDELGTPVPLSDLLRSDLEERVTAGLVWARFAGDETIAGVPCEHVSLRKSSVDIQLWIESGEQPLIRRLVITYREAPGQPQFWANLSDWSFAPDVSDARFAFHPPKDAERIPFALRAAKQTPPPTPPAPPTTGDRP